MKGSSLTELDEIRIDPARHHRGKHEPGPAAGYVQIYVKSSALSRSGGATQLALPPRRAPLKQQSHF